MTKWWDLKLSLDETQGINYPYKTAKSQINLGSTPKELQIIPEFAQVLDFPL